MPSTADTPSAHPDPHHARRWLILGVIGIAQLMVVLDATIVNIALPSAQADLGFSDGGRQWVITAYALAFGSLLLLGGRIGDLFGRKRIFIVGLLGFAAASALGGSAPSFAVLIAARALQGMFGALLAPAALSLLTTTFTEPAERSKAFAVYGAIAGIGGSIGLLLGGTLTELFDWRWCLYVTVFFATPAAFAAGRLLHHMPAPQRPRLDIPGTVTASLGLFALVYGVSRAESHGWGDSLTLIAFGLSVVLLLAFVAIQRRVEQPLLPLRIVTDRDRGGSYLAIAMTSGALFGIFLLLTFYLQQTKGMTPLQTGLAFLPMNLTIITTVTIVTTRVLPRTGARPLIPTGMLLIGTGMALLTGVGVDTAYASHVLPPLLVIGLGCGLVFAPSFATATLGVPPRDAGVASATVNTSQQVGGSIGTALLSTISASAASGFLADHGGGAAAAAGAAVEGYAAAFWWAAGFLLVGAVICGALLRSGVHLPSQHGAPEPAAAEGQTAA